MEKIHWAKEREDPEDRAGTWLSQLVPVCVGQSQMPLFPFPPAEKPENRQDSPPEGREGAGMAWSPFIASALSGSLGSPSLELFLHTWLLFHQVFLLRALEESREENLVLGTHRPGLHGCVGAVGTRKAALASS